MLMSHLIKYNVTLYDVYLYNIIFLTRYGKFKIQAFNLYKQKKSARIDKSFQI